MSGHIIKLKENLIKHDLKALFRSNIEETLITLLEFSQAQQIRKPHKRDAAEIYTTSLHSTITKHLSHRIEACCIHIFLIITLVHF